MAYGRFLILTDEHVPYALVEALRSIGDVAREIDALAQEDDPFAAGVRFIKPKG